MSNLNLSQFETEIKEYLNKLHLKELREIQKTVFPLIFDGKNVLLECETGGGKTLAYLLPILIA